MHMLKRAMRGAATMAIVGGLLAGGSASAQAPNPYAAPIGVDVARKAAAAAIVEGKKNGWTVAAAVVDAGGALVYYERIDGTQ
jgi:hypothetical protein